MNNGLFYLILNKIEEGDQISPFLFISQQSDKLDFEVETLISKLLKQYNIDKMSLFTLKDDGSNLKIKVVKDFVSQSETKSRFKFQIFYIENINRFTLKAANSCLKNFEEPGVGNIFFLSNNSESGVLDTILSRVQIVNLESGQISPKSEFYYGIIDNYLKNGDIKIFSYFFSAKLEKDEYISFLKTLIIYIKDNLVLVSLLDEIEEDLTLIKKNNLLAKYFVDKYLFKMKN